MGFLGDIKEVHEGWKEKSWGYKTLVIASLFFTTTSITGLAGLIIQWKGFIKTGIDFYHQYIVGPMREVFSWVNLNPPEEYIDASLVMYFSIYPITMVFSEEITKKFGKSSVIFSRLVMVYFLFFPALLFFFEPPKNMDHIPYAILGLLAIYFFTMVTIFRYRC